MIDYKSAGVNIDVGNEIVDRIKDKVKKTFFPVMEANLTLSFDHRVLDGGAAGRLLSRVSELMKKPEDL